MDGDAYREMSHKEMQQALFKMFSQIYDVVSTEYPIANGRIADIYIKEKNRVVIVEVKTQLKASLMQECFGKYAPHCDRLYMATPPALFYQDTLPSVIGWADTHIDKIGILLVEWHRITLMKEAAELRP